MNKAIEREINKIYTAIFNRVFSKSRINTLSKGDRLQIVEAISVLESSEDYNKFASRFAKALAKRGIYSQRGLWRKYYNAARKLHYISLPKTFTEYETNVMNAAVQNNFTMIKTIPREILKVLEHKYTETLIEEVAKGNLSRGSFEKQLRQHGAKNARLIARTETAKLQTTIVETRAGELGSVAYIWRASNDKRTRPSHKEMNDVVVFWRPPMQKPLRDNMRGNAGEFPNCRCSPQPIIDVDYLTKATYKVYDYLTDTIISMNKSTLIEHIKKGSLEQ